MLKQVNGQDVSEVIPMFTHKPAEAYGFRFADQAHATRGMLLIHPMAVDTNLTTLHFRRKAHTVLPAYPMPGVMVEDNPWLDPTFLGIATRTTLSFSQRYGYAVNARQTAQASLQSFLVAQQNKVQQLALSRGSAIHVKMATELNFSALEGRIAGLQIVIDDPLNP